MMAQKTTWDTIRMVTLQKMFISTGDTITENDSNRDYLQSMPGAYNEAVMLLSTTNRYIVKTFEYQTDGISNSAVIDLDTIDDLYQLKPNGIYFVGTDGTVSEHVKEKMIGSTLILGCNKSGTYQISYYAYPLTATLDTNGETDMQLDPDVAVLVPLYMASQLYKDDDIAIATQYRNEFEIGRELLKIERGGSSASEFKNTTGWWE